MATARKILERSFSMAGIRAAETPLTAAEIADGLDLMNDLLSLWDATGTLKGVAPVMGADDEVNADRHELYAIKSNVAIGLAGEYGIPVNQSLAHNANTALSGLVSANINLRDIKYPSTLPVGSGNRDEFGTGYDRDFFPENEKENF